MAREVEYEFGCFRCGEFRPPIQVDSDTGKIKCKGCGEESIVTFRQALDMINNYHLLHKDDIEKLMEYDEYYLDLGETV